MRQVIQEQVEGPLAAYLLGQEKTPETVVGLMKNDVLCFE